MQLYFWLIVLVTMLIGFVLGSVKYVLVSFKLKHQRERAHIVSAPQTAFRNKYLDSSNAIHF